MITRRVWQKANKRYQAPRQSTLIGYNPKGL
jgi:hypothetical protein